MQGSPRPGLPQPLCLLRPLGAGSGLSLLGCQSGLGLGELVLWIISWEPAPPGSFVWQKQGLAGLPPHHLPAPASSWCFHPQRLLKLQCFEIRPPQRGPLCSSQALGAGRGGGPKNSVQAKPWRQILSLPGTSRVILKPKGEGPFPPLAPKLYLQLSLLKEHPRASLPLAALASACSHLQGQLGGEVGRSVPGEQSRGWSRFRTWMEPVH